ncbi:hypothetical protein K438DRAFT_1749137 [Mycena galopus ATCC 62051]|nr:hypothetical protein K438DRAFT_1749137 [Mycena galopus ATCC 62051]
MDGANAEALKPWMDMSSGPLRTRASVLPAVELDESVFFKDLPHAGIDTSSFNPMALQVHNGHNESQSDAIFKEINPWHDPEDPDTEMTLVTERAGGQSSNTASTQNFAQSILTFSTVNTAAIGLPSTCGEILGLALVVGSCVAEAHVISCPSSSLNSDWIISEYVVVNGITEVQTIHCSIIHQLEYSDEVLDLPEHLPSSGRRWKLNAPVEQTVSRARPEVRAFYRAIDAVCAWTTGSRYILSSSIAKSKAPLSLSIVDLPREDVPEHSVEVLAARWMERGRWTPSTHQIVTESLRSFQADAQEKESKARRRAMSGTVTTEGAVEVETSAPTIASVSGACHCEAGLIASVIIRQFQLEPQLEPTVLTDGFADLDVSPEASFTIGVAKKCCPTCKFLIDILRTDNRFKIDIAGAHSRFTPWVPPTWLPLKVLDQMEERLLSVVKNMVTERNFSGSRASSPASDQGDNTEFIFHRRVVGLTAGVSSEDGG